MFWVASISRIKVQLLIVVLLGLSPAVEWDSIIRLTVDPRTQEIGFSRQKCIAVDPSRNVWVFWRDERSPVAQIWYRRFDWTSGIWEPESQLTRLEFAVSPPSVASDRRSNIHLTWQTDDDRGKGIWYKKFLAQERRWLAETLLVSPRGSYNLRYPVIAVEPDSEILHLVYYGNPDTGGLYQIFHKEYRLDSGWLPSEQITTHIGNHEDAAVAVDSAGDLCVVFLGTDLGSQFNHSLCRRRIGGVWQEIEQVSSVPGYIMQFSPTVAAGRNGNWHVVWYGQSEQQFHYQIFHRQGTPSGWSEVFTVSRGVSYPQYSPAVVVGDGEQCYLVWQGTAPNSPQVNQLQFAHRDANGNWSVPQLLSNFTSGNVDRPAIVLDSRLGLHIAFQQDSAGNRDVYYLHGEILSPGIGEPAGFLPLTVLNKRFSFGNWAGKKIYNSLGAAVGVPFITPGVYLIENRDNSRVYYQKVIILGTRR